MVTTSSELVNVISTLTPEQRDAVAAFIRYLKERTPEQTLSTRNAVEEFMREHAQILQLLAE